MTATFWLYSHNFTHSGAPLVLAAIARELAAAGLREQLRIVSWGGLHDQRHSTLQKELIAEGIHCQVLDPSQSPPNIKQGDRVLLNTVALPEAVLQQALAWRLEGKIKRLDWYAHESDPEVWIQNKSLIGKLRGCLELGILRLKVPSTCVRSHYQNWLQFYGPGLGIQIPRLEISRLFASSRILHPHCFGEIKLVLVGAVGCGNKGHLWLLRLLEMALHLSPNSTYGLRPLKLQFLGIETGKYASLAKSVIDRGKQLLDENHFSWSEATTRDEMLQQLYESNILVNCSLKEAFSCVSSEAMSLGLPLLRMQNGGFEEQLIEGSTGFDLGKPRPVITGAQIDLIQTIRNPSLISSDQLSKMSIAAQKHSQKLSNISYLDWLLKKDN